MILALLSIAASLAFIVWMILELYFPIIYGS
jgi:hypothetical protein